MKMHRLDGLHVPLFLVSVEDEQEVRELGFSGASQIEQAAGLPLFLDHRAVELDRLPTVLSDGLFAGRRRGQAAAACPVARAAPAIRTGETRRGVASHADCGKASGVGRPAGRAHLLGEPVVRSLRDHLACDVQGEQRREICRTRVLMRG